MKLSKNKNVNIIFFIAIIGLVLSLGFLILSSQNTAKLQSPSLIAYSTDHGAILGTDSFLFHTDSSGTFLKKYKVEDLGLSRYLSDLVIFNDSLYVADAKSHNILRCKFPLS